MKFLILIFLFSPIYAQWAPQNHGNAAPAFNPSNPLNFQNPSTDPSSANFNPFFNPHTAAALRSHPEANQVAAQHSGQWTPSHAQPAASHPIPPGNNNPLWAVQGTKSHLPMNENPTWNEQPHQNNPLWAINQQPAAAAPSWNQQQQWAPKPAAPQPQQSWAQPQQQSWAAPQQQSWAQPQQQQSWAQPQQQQQWAAPQPQPQPQQAWSAPQQSWAAPQPQQQSWAQPQQAAIAQPAQSTHNPAPIHYARINPSLNGEVAFGYHTGGQGAKDNSFREETRLPDGTVKGAYGYIDGSGKKRIIRYTAGKEGFKVDGDVHPDPTGPAPAAPQAAAPAAPAVPQFTHQPSPHQFGASPTGHFGFSKFNDSPSTALKSFLGSSEKAF